MEKSGQYEGLRAAGGAIGGTRIFEIVCGINR